MLNYANCEVASLDEPAKPAEQECDHVRKLTHHQHLRREAIRRFQFNQKINIILVAIGNLN